LLALGYAMRNPPRVSIDRSPLVRYRCDGCGHDSSLRDAPDRCPRCGGVGWEEHGWKPFADLVADVAPARRAAGPPDVDAPLVREAAEHSVFPGVPLH
jgi:hypothetical protein